MADDIVLNTGSGGDTVAADEIGGKKHQRVKLQYGDDGAATDVSDTNPLPIDDAGGSLTVDAPVATPVNVQISDGADTALVSAAGALNVDGSGVTQPVSAATLPLPSGAATAAKQLADGHNVAVNAALPAGTNAIGKLAANSGVDIGDVDVTSVVPGVGATNLGKAEDAVHSSGDVGVMVLGVRTDAPVSTVADGDYAPLLTSEEGALWVENLPSEVDANNSSTSTLTASSVFTGTGVDLLDHQAVAVNISASHDSAVDGMQFQFSSDGTNWDISYIFTYTAADGGRAFQFGIYAKYFRVMFTNGSTGQTHFRCQTLLHHETTLTSIHRLVDDTSPDRSAEIVKSAIIAQAAGSGNFVPVQATATGNFKISLEEVDGAIAGGGTEAAALRVTMANDSTGLLSIDDNGGSLTVDAPTGTPVNVQIGDGTNQASVTALANGLSNPTALEVGAFSMVWNGATWDKAHSAGSASDGIATDTAGYQFTVGCTMGFNGTTWDRLRSTIANGLDVDVTRVGGTVTVDNGGTFAVQVDAALPAGANLIGDVGLSGARTSGGTTLYKNIDVDETEDEIKGTAGQLYWVHVMNLSAGVLFLKIYDDTAANVIVGTTVPDLTFPIPTQGDTNGAGFALTVPNGIAFGTAITIACTTGIGTADIGPPGANECVVNLGYG